MRKLPRVNKILGIAALLAAVLAASQTMTCYICIGGHEWGAVPVRKIRADAREIRKPVLQSGPSEQGWSKSPADPEDLLACFPRLKLKPGYKLVSYQFMEGGNGNGFVWALPAEAAFPEPEQCETVEGIGYLKFLQVPKPPQALDNVMEAVEGDGGPVSYLQASIFGRESREFGAVWHGSRWDTHVILFASAFGLGDHAVVCMATYSGLFPEGVYGFIDTYDGGYVFTTREITAWQGEGGYLF